MQVRRYAAALALCLAACSGSEGPLDAGMEMGADVAVDREGDFLPLLARVHAFAHEDCASAMGLWCFANCTTSNSA
ncbi:MAG: hypothetical protein AAF645_02705 [Myxococcota bacterium]